MLKRTIQAVLIGYVVLGLATPGLEEVGLYHAADATPTAGVSDPVSRCFDGCSLAGTRGRGIADRSRSSR